MNGWAWLLDRDFWSGMGIPTIAAGATVAAVIAATVTSRQALRIAKASDLRAERESMLRAAAEQARLLIHWTHLHRQAAAIPYLATVDTGGSFAISRAFREARGALLVSDVPGADLLLALAEHDLQHAWRYTPPAPDIAQH